MMRFVATVCSCQRHGGGSRCAKLETDLDSSKHHANQCEHQSHHREVVVAIGRQAHAKHDRY
jgi:hypothetical protein